MTASHTDHTREYVPLLAHYRVDRGRRHDGPLADVGASVLHWLAGRESSLPGDPFQGLPAPGEGQGMTAPEDLGA